MYYQGSSEIQGDGLHKLYLMNPNYIGYSDTQHQHQYFHEGIPLSHNPNRPSSVLGHQQEIQATHNMVPIPGFNHNLWESIDRPNILQQRPKNLSLSLSAHQTGLSKPIYSGQDLPGQSNRVNSEQSVILGSKYLKAAQQLLDEVANVGKGVLQGDRPESSKGKSKVDKDSIAVNLEASTGAELTTAQRQEILMKKAKLVNMLDEVEQRYRQYHQQMQIIVASFEQAAGIGSAKSYTHLALKTISKQFRCLKDALSEQIKALNKNLGEEEKLESSKLKFIDHQFGRHRPLHQLGMLQNSAWRTQRGLPESAVSVLRAWLFENFLHPYPKDSDKQMLAKQTGLTRSQVSNWFINARVRLWKPMVEEMYSEEMKNQQPQTNTEENTNKTRPKIIGTTSSRISTQQANNSKTSEFDKLKALQFKQDSPSEKNPKKPRNDAQDNSLSSILSVETEINKAGDTRKAFTTAAPNTNTRFGSYGIGELSRFGSEQFARGFHGNNVNNYNSNVSLTLALPPSAASSQITHQQTNFFTSFGGTSTGARIINETGTVENSAVNGIIDPDGASHPNIGYQMLDFQNRKPFPAQFFPDFVA